MEALFPHAMKKDFSQAPRKKYVIALPPADRDTLRGILRKGRHAAREISRARILLLADDGKSEKEIADQESVDFTTVYRIEQRYLQGDLSFALSERPRPGAPRKTDSADEAVITAIACTEPPGGCDHWTLDLLCAELKQRHREIKRMTLWRILLKHDLKPWREKNVGHSAAHPGVHPADDGHHRSLRTPV